MIQADEIKGVHGKWYAVHRKDGVIQYAQFLGDGFVLYGSGFHINAFDADKVVPIEGEPPNNIVYGTVHLDNYFKCRGFNDMNRRWNGWAMPWILEEDIDYFIAEMNPYTKECGIGDLFEHKGDTLIITQADDPDADPEVVEVSVINGKRCFYMGNIGWCFQFKREEDEKG